MPVKCVKMKILKKKIHIYFFSSPKDHSTQKLGSYAKRVWPVDRAQTDRQTHIHIHTEWLLLAPFQVFRIFFPSTYHQGLVHHGTNNLTFKLCFCSFSPHDTTAALAPTCRVSVDLFGLPSADFARAAA